MGWAAAGDCEQLFDSTDRKWSAFAGQMKQGSNILVSNAQLSCGRAAKHCALLTSDARTKGKRPMLTCHIWIPQRAGAQLCIPNMLA